MFQFTDKYSFLPLHSLLDSTHTCDLSSNTLFLPLILFCYFSSECMTPTKQIIARQLSDWPPHTQTNSICLASFTSLISTHVVFSSFHSTRTLHTFVVFLGILECFPVKLFSFVTAPASLRWSTISLMNKIWFPSLSNWEYTLYAMTLAKYLSVVPSSNSTSYSLVSRSGLLCTRTIANPFASVARRFKVVMMPPLLVLFYSLTVTPI